MEVVSLIVVPMRLFLDSHESLACRMRLEDLPTSVIDFKKGVYRWGRASNTFHLAQPCRPCREVANQFVPLIKALKESGDLERKG